MDFTHIYDLVEDLYCKDNDRTSIAPVVIFKMVLISSTIALFVPRIRYCIFQQQAEKDTRKLKAEDIFVKNARRDTNTQKIASMRKP